MLRFEQYGRVYGLVRKELCRRMTKPGQPHLKGAPKTRLTPTLGFNLGGARGLEIRLANLSKQICPYRPVEFAKNAW